MTIFVSSLLDFILLAFGKDSEALNYFFLNQKLKSIWNDYFLA